MADLICHLVSRRTMTLKNLVKFITAVSISGGPAIWFFYDELVCLEGTGSKGED